MARVGKVLSVIILGAAVGAVFQNCSKALPSEAQAVLASQGASPLSIQAATTDIAASATLQLTAAGGTPPYTFAVMTGTGTLDSANLFTAPAVTETDVVEVTDSKGNNAHITINILAPLALSYSPSPALATEKIKLTGSGGRAPYTYQLLAGVGTLTGNEFTPGAVPLATTLVQVTDADGRTKQVSISVTMPAKTALYIIYEPSGGSRSLATDPNAGAAYGYASLGFAFNIFSAQMPDSAAVNHCVYGNFGAYPLYNLYVVGSCPSGYSNTGVAGYVSTIARPNTIPIYGNASYRYFMSRNASDISALGYAPAVMGYALP
jgi:hypothetical protein